MNILYGAIAAILILAGDGALFYHFGTQHSIVKTDTQELKTAAADATQVHTQEITDNTAEAVHDQEVEHPPILGIPEPVRVCPSASVRVVQVPAPAASVSAPERPTDPGPGIDLRPQLAAFALKYENALSDCRRMAAEWPK